MTIDTLVSVIMPAYNAERFIGDAVRSVLNQSWSHLELIVVDDGSRDNTLDIVSQVKDSRIKVLKQRNGGSSSARNTGIREARGGYVAFLDGDDCWESTKLQRHIAIFNKQTETDLTFSLSRIVDEHGSDTGRRSKSVRGVVSFRQLLIENIVNNGSAVVLRRAALDRAGLFDEALPSCVDHDMWLRIALLKSANIYCIPEYLTRYRMHSSQITKDWKRMEFGWMAMIEKMRRLAPADVAAVESVATGRLYRYLGYIAYENGSFAESRSLVRQALGAGGFSLLGDRRTVLLSSALIAELIMPKKLHMYADRAIRWTRAR